MSGPEGEDGDNDLGGYTFSFESGKATNELGITAFGGPLTMENDSTVAHNGSHSIKAYGHENTWTSPTKDILSYVQNNGAATYSLDAWIYCTADAPHCSFRLRFLGIDKEADNPSFANELFVTGGNQNVCYYVNGAVEAETWTKFHLTFTVSEEDLNKGTSWVPCFCDIPVGATFWIDDLSLRLHGAEYQQDENGNYIPAGDSSFEDVTSPYDTNWIIFGGSQKMEIDSTVAHSGSCSLKAFDHKNEWTSPSYSLFNMFKDLGYGKYTISAWVRADKESAGVTLRMRCLDVLSEEDNPSFVNEPYVNGGNANTAISLGAKDIQADEWVEFTDSFIIKDEDIQNDHTWELNFTGFQPGTTFWIDDVTVKKFVNPDLYFTYETSTDMVEKINVLNGRKVKINAITAESIEDDELIWEVIATVEELEEILHSQSVYVKPVRGSVVIIRATLKSNPELVAEVQMKVKANLAPLRTLIIKAEKLLEDSISDDAKQKLTAEIGKAQDLLDADEITQDQVDEALDVLQAAIDAVTAE